MRLLSLNKCLLHSNKVISNIQKEYTHFDFAVAKIIKRAILEWFLFLKYNL